MQNNNFLTNRKTLRKGKRLSSNDTTKVYNSLDLTITEMFEKFIQYKQSEVLTKVTIDDYYRYFRYFLEYVNGDLEKDAINLEVFYGYINHMLHDKGLSPVTVNVRIRPLRALLRFSYLEGYINTPIHERFKPVKTEEDTIQSFTTTEVKTLIANIDETFYAGFRNKVMVLLLLDTMVRVSELLKMKRSNVDLKVGQIALEAHETKTKRKRIVPISTRTCKLLAQYIEETNDFNEDTLFLTYDGHTIASNTFRKNLADYGKKAGIHNKRVSPHTFRHTGALFYIMNGGDPFSLQKILGHSDMSMVRKYIQMTNTDVKRQHNSFSPLKNVFKR